MKQPMTSRQNSWVGRLLLFAAGLPGLLAFFFALLPASIISFLAVRFGHAADVTPERIVRLRVVASLLAAAHLLLVGFLATAGRAAAMQFLDNLRAEVSSARPMTGVRHLTEWLTEPGWLHWIMLAVVLAVAFFIRLAYLQVPMDYDEAHSFLNYARRPLYQALSDYNSTNNHLLNTLCMHVGFNSFGPDEWALRLHVFLAGLAAVGTIYILGRQCAGPDAGLIAAAIATTSYVMVNYSVNARGYIWTVWMTALLLVAFWRIAHSSFPLAVDWLGAGLAAVLGLFALPTMLYPIAGCVGWLALRWLRCGAGAKGRLVVLSFWALLVGLAVFWLYAPAIIYQGDLALRHPFVRPQQFAPWLSHVPWAWLLALRSWAEGPVPWLVSAVLCGVGLPGLWVLNRDAFWLIVSVPLATFALMSLQRVAPPPRVMSFLTPVFCVLAAAGVVAIVRLASLPQSAADSFKSSRAPSALCSWLACSVCAWGYFGIRHQPLPGGLRPAFLVEDVADAWSRDFLAQPAGPNQLWRLDVKEVVDTVKAESSSGDRVLVALPADLPFHFYAAQRGWNANIGGRPKAGERLFLVIRAGETPQVALRENLTLIADQPWDVPDRWGRLAAGELAIWLAEPAPPMSTESVDP